MADNPLLISGRSNVRLAKGIAERMGVSPTKCDIVNFSDGEIFCQILENIRGGDVFIIQSTCPPVNDYLMELLIITDAVKRASARRITAVIPYFGYARQDRKVQSRTPITARLVADLVVQAGADRALFLDLHAGQIQGFFDKPVDHLYGTPLIVEAIKKNGYEDLVMVSPDAGGVERARVYAKSLNCGLGIIDKRREGKNLAKAMNIIGDVRDKNVMIVDDMVDTAGTLTEGVNALIEAGAKTVQACCSHAVLSGKAIDRLNSSPITKLYCTNSIDQTEHAKRCAKIESLDIAPLFAEAVDRIHHEKSVSSLFEY
ncbi:MAG: ribose-phosphate pyrophosphokinase [Nitrospinae bacterium]|nr:ribose-phosphate pyrophosphokinase [Nitrospinota bacterium]